MHALGSVKCAVLSMPRLERLLGMAGPGRPPAQRHGTHGGGGGGGGGDGQVAAAMAHLTL